MNMTPDSFALGLPPPFCKFDGENTSIASYIQCGVLMLVWLSVVLYLYYNQIKLRKENTQLKNGQSPN